MDSVDAKHKNILANIQGQKEYVGITLDNLKNCGVQGDLGAPMTLRYLLLEFNMRTLKQFIYYIFYARDVQKQVKNNIKLDFDYLENMGYLKILKNNPVNKTPGKTLWFSHKGFKFNLRWLRYIYLANRISKMNMVENSDIWVDIGSFYGGLQSIVYRSRPQVNYVLVDFKHQLLRSYLFLSELYPNAKHKFGDQLSSQDFNEGGFLYLSIDQINLLDNIKVKLVSNFFSFGEMKREFFYRYTKAKFFRYADSFYLVNRFVSSPNFEKTYDSDLNVLDYQFPEFIIRHFDVFPIHHYAAWRRGLFGSQRTVNTSSSYFEMFATKID